MYISKTKLFVSFDFDHDESLKHLFVGQAKHNDTPFEVKDMSVKQALTGDWQEKVRQRIRNCEQVAVICGEYTNSAAGVAAEIRIAQEEGKPYFLLKGYRNKQLSWPSNIRSTDKMYDWTWDNVRLLLQGRR